MYKNFYIYVMYYYKILDDEYQRMMGYIGGRLGLNKEEWYSGELEVLDGYLSMKKLRSIGEFYEFNKPVMVGNEDLGKIDLNIVTSYYN